MRRFLVPVVLLIIGLGFIVTYLALRYDPAEPVISTGGNLTGTQPALASTLPASASTPPALAGQPSLEPSLSPETSQSPTPLPPTQTAQPIFPTSTFLPPGLDSTDSVGLTATNTAATSIDMPGSTTCPLPDCRLRTGVSGRKEMATAAYEAGLPFGLYLNWWAEANPPEPDDVSFWQMVPISAAGPTLSWQKLGEIVDARPGSVWIVGNEPDIIWQDNTPAERYAQIYHDVYTFIKARDPQARLAIAGVGQPTPLRMAYLDIVLDSYLETYGEPLPIDIWTIHGFVLREEQDSWGVGIPPGMGVEQGELYEIEDHKSLVHFRQNLINFRAWMAARGYGDRPLAVTEFGILHPADYGFSPDVVAEFLIGAFDFFATARNETGYPDDENRLVQWWLWYSVYDGGDFPTGNLYDPEVGQLTPVGRVFAALVNGE